MNAIFPFILFVTCYVDLHINKWCFFVFSSEELMKVAVILIGTVLILYLLIAAAKWRNLKDKSKKNNAFIILSWIWVSV